MMGNTVPGSAKPKGKPRGGSRKGIQNKATQTARAAIGAFVDGNADRLAGWLDEIAAESPEKAFRAFMDVVEYHVPKLARTVVAGDPDAPLQVQTVTRRVLDPRGA